MRPFQPLLANAHAQTILGAFWPRPKPAPRFPVSTLHYQTDPGVRILVYAQSPPQPRSAVLLIHGLEGSADRGYMLSAASTLLDAGCIVHRMNIRGCGGTEPHTNTLYHAGLTSDLRIAVERLAATCGFPVHLCGFSLGANMSVKLAGELAATAPSLLASVISVSNPIDLHACAIRLLEPQNWLYQQRFVRNMADRLWRRHQLMPDRFPLSLVETARRVRSVLDFDDRITAPHFGFGTAERYYATQSSHLFCDEIRVPTLFLHAQDDPMIPFSVYQNPVFARNPRLTLHTPPHGGHVGFLARGSHRFFIDTILRDWIVHIREQSGC